MSIAAWIGIVVAGVVTFVVLYLVAAAIIIAGAGMREK